MIHDTGMIGQIMNLGLDHMRRTDHGLKIYTSYELLGTRGSVAHRSWLGDNCVWCLVHPAQISSRADHGLSMPHRSRSFCATQILTYLRHADRDLSVPHRS